MSQGIFTRFLAAAKVKAKNGYHWSLKNQTLASGGLMLAGTIGGTMIIVWDNRQGTRDVKNDVDQKHRESRLYFDKKYRESRLYFDKKFAKLDNMDLETQRLILSCARSTMKGFQGDTTEIADFIKSVEVFEKAMECVEKGGC